MTTKQSRALAMLKRVQAFEVNHGGAFAPGSNAEQRFTRNQSFIAQVEAEGAAQKGASGSGHGGTALKSNRVEQLNRQIKAIVETGKTVFAPGDDNDNANVDLEKQMRIPKQGKVSELLRFARALKTTVQPFAPAFVAEEMPADFLTRLQSAIDAVDTAEGDQNQGDLEEVEATGTLTPLTRRAIANVRSLDAPVNNKFADDAGILSEWDSASHIQVGVVGRHDDAPVTTT